MKKLLTFFISVLVVAIVFLVMIFSGKENNPPIENGQITTPTITPNPDDEFDYNQPIGGNEEQLPSEDEKEEDVVFTEDENAFVENTFSALLKNEDYQTKVQEGDILVDITFKGVGTVTFKMYQKTAPTSVNWFLDLVKNNTEVVTKPMDSTLYRKFYFVTTEREYERTEQVPDIFPMKYTLYHRLTGCHTFFFCTSNYVENEIDNNNVDPTYLEYLKKYGGNFAEFGHCVVLGRAVTNAELLDQLPSDYVIEKIEIKN